MPQFLLLLLLLPIFPSGGGLHDKTDGRTEATKLTTQIARYGRNETKG